MTVFPVTNAQFAAFIEATGYVTPAEPRMGHGFHRRALHQTPGATWQARAAWHGQPHPRQSTASGGAGQPCRCAGVLRLARVRALPTEAVGESPHAGPMAGAFPGAKARGSELCRHGAARCTAPRPWMPLPATPARLAYAASPSNTWEWTVSAYAPASPYLVLRGGAWPHARAVPDRNLPLLRPAWLSFGCTELSLCALAPGLNINLLTTAAEAAGRRPA